MMSGFTRTIVAALLAGMLWHHRYAPRRGWTDEETLQLLWWSATGAFIGGRLAYLLRNADYFRLYPSAILAFRQTPGLGGEGLWAGGLLAAFLWSRRHQRPPREALALLAPPALLVAAAGWWACEATGCAWGKVAVRIPSWQRPFVLDAPDIYHTVMPRYAVQRLKAAVMLVLAVIAHHPRRGVAALIAALLWSAAIASLQGDLQPAPCGLRLDQWLDLLLAALLVPFLRQNYAIMGTSYGEEKRC